MKRVYKPFFAVLIVLAAGLVLPHPVRAQAEDVFTVEGVHADASAESATKARETAFSQAQLAAFTTLAGRILAAQDLPRLKAPGVATIGPMIQDFEIVSERISAVRYIGTYTFRFDPGSVRTFLNGQGFEVSETSAPAAAATASESSLILPFLQFGGGTILWGGNNPWRGAWERMQAANPSALVPLGDLQDVQDMPDEAALTYDRARLEAMLARYGAARAVIAIARPLPDPDGKDSVGSLEVYLYKTTPDGPVYLQTVTVAALSGVDLYAEAAKQVSDMLRGLPSRGRAGADAASQILALHVTFSGSDQWMATRRALETLPGLRDIGIESLTPRSAVLSAAFSGDGPRFITLAQAQGLVVTATQSGAYDACLAVYCQQQGSFAP